MKYGRYMPSLMVTFLSFAISMHMSDHALGIEALSNRLHQHIYSTYPSQQYCVIPIKITFSMRNSLSAEDFYNNYIHPDGSRSPAYRYWWSRPKKSRGHDEYRLGQIFMHGIGFEINYREAKFWLEKSAAMEYPPGMYLLGHLYHIFYDRETNISDLESAECMLLKAAKALEKEAPDKDLWQCNTFIRLVKEELQKVKEKLAPFAEPVSHIEEPASNPFSSILSAIEAPFDNLDTPEPSKDEKHAGHESDLTLIAKKKYDQGMESYNNNEYKKAMALFEESSTLGNSDADFWLGVCIHFGFCRTETEQDYKKIAAEHYQIAANKGVILAIDMIEAIKNIDGFKEYIRNKK